MLNESIDMMVILPYKIFMEVNGVKRIVAESEKGAFGILPNRLDCVSTIVPGVLVYETDHEHYLAVDEGILLKAGPQVLLAVHHAIAGPDLKDLHEVVKNEFLNMSKEEVNLRTRDFVRRFTDLMNEK